MNEELLSVLTALLQVGDKIEVQYLDSGFCQMQYVLEIHNDRIYVGFDKALYNVSISKKQLKYSTRSNCLSAKCHL